MRTLVLGTRILDQDEFKIWNEDYQAAICSLADNRDVLINACCERIEKDFQLIGITAIEDKLQVNYC